MKNLYGICYKTKEPTYYNKGTKWEKTCSEFLFKQCYGKENAEKFAEEYNAMLVDAPKIDGLDFGTVEYFFVEESCEMY